MKACMEKNGNMQIMALIEWSGNSSLGKICCRTHARKTHSQNQIGDESR